MMRSANCGARRSWLRRILRNHAALAKALSKKGLNDEAAGRNAKGAAGAAAIAASYRLSLKHFLQLLTRLRGPASAACAAATSPAATVAPNVILITIDTVRADHVGCYGATNVQTPTLDGLARDGIVFERAISQVPLTWPSHAAILTGTYPFQNGVQDFTGQPLDPRFRSVAQVFKQQGYATGAVVSAFVLDRSWGLARGFDFYDDAFSRGNISAKRYRAGGSQSWRKRHAR